MASLNDLKHTALYNAGFVDGTLNDREYQWLAYHTSIESGATLNDQWSILLTILGYSTGTINDRQMQAWSDLGHTASGWPARAMQFWTAGGEWIPAFVLLESGDHVLLETGDDLLLD